MSRRTNKAKALKTYLDIKSGKVKQVSWSPNQLRKYGQYLPAEIAAPMHLAVSRGTTARSRASWAIARITFREPTRTRTRKI